MNATKTCSMDGCDLVLYARGLCRRHYLRQRKSGVLELKTYATVFDSFVSKIRHSSGGCWEWTASKTAKGYGQISVNRNTVLAHRYSYETFIGAIPTGMLVCHHCDNPSCVNPCHFFVGTKSDNYQDAKRKGRIASRRGTNNGKAVITEDDAMAVVSILLKGLMICDIVAATGIRTNIVQSIASGRRWSHIRSEVA